MISPVKQLLQVSATQEEIAALNSWNSSSKVIKLVESQHAQVWGYTKSSGPDNDDVTLTFIHISHLQHQQGQLTVLGNEI